CIDKVHGFACVFLPHFLQTAPFPARSERVSATALKPPRKAGGRGGESTAHPSCKINLYSKKFPYLYTIIEWFKKKPPLKNTLKILTKKIANKLKSQSINTLHK
ncbi:TPA: hypothetical protein ACIYRU_004688, partial [Escherichia coli]